MTQQVIADGLWAVEQKRMQSMREHPANQPAKTELRLVSEDEPEDG